MEIENTFKMLRAIGVRDAKEQVTMQTRRRRARKDAGRTIATFVNKNQVAIGNVKDFYSDHLQHVLSLHLDVERQRFMARHQGRLHSHYLVDLWYNMAEHHPGVFWVLCDLERERDLREGRWHLWRKHIYETPEAVTGDQMSLIDTFDDEKVSVAVSGIRER